MVVYQAGESLRRRNTIVIWNMEIKWLLTCACRSPAFYALLNFALVPPETFPVFPEMSGSGRLCGGLVCGWSGCAGGSCKVHVAVAVAQSCRRPSKIESKCLCCVSWANRPQRLSDSNDTATPTRHKWWAVAVSLCPMCICVCVCVSGSGFVIALVC